MYPRPYASPTRRWHRHQWAYAPPPALGARTGADPAAVRAGAAEEAMAEVKRKEHELKKREAKAHAELVSAFARNERVVLVRLHREDRDGRCIRR